MATRMSPAGRRATIVAAAGMLCGVLAGVVTGIVTGDAGLAWSIGGAATLLLSGAGAVAARPPSRTGARR